MKNENTLSDEESPLCRQIVVSNPNGLHARPAGKLAQTAQAFDAAVTLAVEDQEVDAKSILDILTLAAAEGSTIELRAAGKDAEQALDQIEALFISQFREE